MKPEAIVKQILDTDTDPLPERWSKQGRQFAVMNVKGEFAAYTGPKASTWAGNKAGKFATAQGNILAGPQVVDNMEQSNRFVQARSIEHPGNAKRRGGDMRRRNAGRCKRPASSANVVERRVNACADDADRSKRVADLATRAEPLGQHAAQAVFLVQVLA